MTKVESTNSQEDIACGQITALRSDEHIDRLVLPLIYQRGNSPSTHIVESASDKRESVRGEIKDRRGEIELARNHGFTVCRSVD